MKTSYDFSTRLRLARAMIAGSPSMPVHLADQFSAAAAETREHHDRLAMVLPLLEPGRNWRNRLDNAPSDEVREHLLAAVLDCQDICPHLRRGGPQPAFFRLPLHRADCQRCAQTVRRAPAGEDDRCDVCGTHGISILHPFAVRLGPALVVGDACGCCAAVLGIVAEVGA